MIIPTFDKAPFLARTLASLEGQIVDGGFEVVVVDDGSSDPTREVARGYDARLDLRYVRRAHMGRAAARNAAIRASRGDVLVFCDDDLLCAPGFVAAHLAAQAGGGCVAVGEQRAVLAQWSSGWDVPVSAIAALLVRKPDIARVLAEAHAELISPDDVRADFDRVIADYALPDPWWSATVAPLVATYGAELADFAFPWAVAATGNLSTTRALADRAGLFDERFVGWGLEDTDFHFRLHRAGAATRVIPAARNYHQLHRRGPEHRREWAANAVRMLEAHDSFELCLYFRVTARALDLATANRIARERAAATGIDELVAEMIRVCRDQLRLLAMQP